MSVSGVSAVKPITPQQTVHAMEQQAAATPPPSMPQTAIPPAGMQGRPPIQNITNDDADPLEPTVAVGEPPHTGGFAEVQAASQAVAEEIIEEDQVEEHEEVASESDSTVLGSDTALVEDMKQGIKEKTDEVSRNVSRSAFKFAFKKAWIKPESAREAETFFTIKVPEVLSQELSKILNDSLGLSEPSA